MAWFERLANVWRAAKLRDDLEEELRFHREARTADNLAAGMSRDQASADALRRFGGPALALDESQDANILIWLETIIQDLRYAMRNLRRNPALTGVALFSLALAICANTSILRAVQV
jgi:hypothetical protein